MKSKHKSGRMPGSLVVGALCLFLGGCGGVQPPDYQSLGLVEVSGKVTLDGAPLAGVTVIFESEDRSFSQGMTDAGGLYRLMYNSEQAGVKPGPKTIRIHSGELGEGAPEDGGEGEEGQPAPPSGPAVPACYGVESKLRIDVTSSLGPVNLDLKSDCSTTAPS